MLYVSRFTRFRFVRGDSQERDPAYNENTCVYFVCSQEQVLVSLLQSILFTRVNNFLSFVIHSSIRRIHF
jgi:hypothetical protein